MGKRKPSIRKLWKVSRYMYDACMMNNGTSSRKISNVKLFKVRTNGEHSYKCRSPASDVQKVSQVPPSLLHIEADPKTAADT